MNQPIKEDETIVRHRRRGIYLLPNLFTTAAMFAGFYAIISAHQGHFEHAAVAIFIAMLLDGLDGRVARLTHTESAFGVQFDSLSDLVSFGLAPALVAYLWSLHFLTGVGDAAGKLGWLAAFLYAVCAALRLARFNVRVETSDSRFFTGLPSPSAAAVLMGLVWLCDDLHITGDQLPWLVLVVTISCGLLMVSNVRFYSFKHLDLRNPVPFITILVMILGLVFMSIDPPKILFTVFTLYALSGPCTWLWQWWRGRRG